MELSDSWHFFQRNLRTIAYIAVGLFVPLELITITLTYYSEQSIFLAIIAILKLLAFAISYAAVISYTSSVIKFNPITSYKAWKIASLQAFQFLGFLIIYYTSVFAGLILLIIPGVIILVRFSFVRFFLVVEKKNIVDSFKLSWRTTKEAQWRLLFGLLLIYFVIFTFSEALKNFLPMEEIDTNVMHNFLSSAIFLITYISYQFETIFSYRIYDGTLKSQN